MDSISLIVLRFALSHAIVCSILNIEVAESFLICDGRGQTNDIICTRMWTKCHRSIAHPRERSPNHMLNLDSAMPQTVSNSSGVCKGTVNQRSSKHTGSVNGTALVNCSPLVNRHTPVNTRNPVTTNSCSRGPGNAHPAVGGAPAAPTDSHALLVGGRRDRWRHGPRNKNRKWKSKAPPLPVPDSEDWEKDLLDSVGSVRPQEPYDPEDVSLQGLTSGRPAPPGLHATTDYSPASHHPPPFKWVRHVHRIVDGQFDDAED